MAVTFEGDERIAPAALGARGAIRRTTVVEIDVAVPARPIRGRRAGPPDTVTPAVIANGKAKPSL